jgi:hypothetical protein
LSKQKQLQQLKQPASTKSWQLRMQRQLLAFGKAVFILLATVIEAAADAG